MTGLVVPLALGTAVLNKGRLTNAANSQCMALGSWTDNYMAMVLPCEDAGAQKSSGAQRVWGRARDNRNPWKSWKSIDFWVIFGFLGYFLIFGLFLFFLVKY